MKKKMSVMGVGFQIAVVLVVFTAVTAAVSWLAAPLFRITETYRTLVRITVAAFVVGFSLNLTAAFGMLRAHRRGELATGGLYAVFRHPMYVCMVLITVPGLLLLFNSWLVLTTVIPVYAAYRILARKEEKYLSEVFGGRYRAYLDTVRVKFI
jgi:protein-S-isoprenylcysteine O-methyltransferase Ste14